VLVFGAPEGFYNSVNRGIVSNYWTGQQLLGFLPDSDPAATWLQTDAAISPGSSGGPVVNYDDGELVGVSTWMHTEGQNLNFAIGAEHVHQLLNNLRASPAPLTSIPKRHQDPPNNGDDATPEVPGRNVVRFGNTDIHLLGDATDEDARSLAIALEKAGYIGSSSELKWAVLLETWPNEYIVSFVFEKDAWKQIERVSGVRAIGFSLIDLKLATRLTVRLCDSDYIPRTSETLIKFGSDQLSYSDDVAEADARQLAQALQEIDYFVGTGDGVAVKIESRDESFAVSFMVHEGAWEERDVIGDYREWGQRLIDLGVPVPLTIQLCDEHFVAKRTLVLRRGPKRAGAERSPKKS
jgi:hypothetical protein